MWKVLLADDEEIIVEGLKQLIDWNSLETEVVGTAEDGDELQEKIEQLDPDLVVSDIKMPGKTGLDIIKYYHEKGAKQKFIFISGFQEFSYAQTAVRYGAVDYLLKPVRARDLEDSVKKAIAALQNQKTVSIFHEEKNELEELIRRVDEENGIEDFTDQRDSLPEIDFEHQFFVGISTGIRPDLADAMRQESFERFNLIRFTIYNKIADYFKSNRMGYIVRREDSNLHLLGIFPAGEEDTYIETCILPHKKAIEEEMGVKLCIGFGFPSQEPSQLKNSYKTAKYAFDLYYFEEQPYMDFRDVHSEFSYTSRDFDEAVEEVFREIVARSEQVPEKVDHVMDIIRSMHYGNMYGAENRALIFTGNLGSKLISFHMLDQEFGKMQDALQRTIEGTHTFRELRACVQEHFDRLMKGIEESGKSRDSAMIEQVKAYIRNHYNEDLSIKKLSAIACVSQNYFSAMFKRETGQNYKAYLTRIRMEAALKLLQDTDDKTYEISEKVGYNNVRRFVDAFKQLYTVSPMEYRKQLRSKGTE